MINVLEVKDPSLWTIGIIDKAKSIIWHSVYYGVGDFEIYAQATEKNINLLQVGFFISNQDNDEIGIIEQIAYDFTPQDGYTITASGRFAKSILDRRIIYNLSGSTNTPTILSGRVESAIRGVVSNNAINCAFDSSRNIPLLGLGIFQGISARIIDANGDPAQKQVSYQNLLEYTDSVLQEYGLSSKVSLNDISSKLLYTVYEGTDRSSDNTMGFEPIIFSVDYDNLNSSNYSYGTQTLKNAVLVGGAGEGLDRFYSLYKGSEEGLDLRELFVDAASINRTYKDSENIEHQYSDEEYTEMLNQQGRQSLKEYIINESFLADANGNYGIKRYNRDYYLGDIVTVQDNYIKKYINVRITEVTEVQDDSGYMVNIVFGDQ